MKANRIFSLRMPATMRAGLDLAAAREGRSVASLVKRLVAEHLDAEGVPWREPSEGRERRRAPRHAVSVPASLRVITSSGDAADQPGNVVNISRSGAFFVSEALPVVPPRLPATALLMVDLPDRPEPLALCCHAVRITANGEGGGVGLRCEERDGLGKVVRLAVG